jgi:hypothetical protein
MIASTLVRLEHIGGELVAQRTEMITIQTTRRLGRDVKIRRSQTEGKFLDKLSLSVGSFTERKSPSFFVPTARIGCSIRHGHWR